MAIKDMKGTVTTTGMMNNKPAPMKAPDMSKIKMPTERKQTVQKPVQQPVKQPAPQESGLAEKIQSFVSDLAGQMEQETTVPPDTQMANQPDDMMSPEMDTVDSGLLA